jgi:hypothetical protein
MERWLNEHWVAAALCMAIVLTLLIPVLAARSNVAWLLVYSLLPVYMFHQVEEHTDDRFREFVNRKIFGGVEALSHAGVLWINLPGVWGVGLVSIYAATYAGTGWGLSIVYLTLLNAIVHIAAGIGQGEYNPGLWTSLGLFLPVSGVALWAVSHEPGVTWMQQVVGMSVGIAVHVATIVYAKGRVRRLSHAA